MIFASDNWAGAHPLIAERLAKAAGSYTSPYGESDADKAVEDKLSTLFEREVSVFFVATGTAANSISLAATARTASVIFCHSEAHVIHHEGGAVELMTNAGKLVGVGGTAQGKIDPARLVSAMTRYPSTDVHVGQKVALTLSQATEAGTIYTLDEIRALTEIARSEGLKVHMDGARFSNAVAALGCTPAEMTWKSGVDILSLGGTKNGCWCAEAIVCFNKEDAAAIPHLRKRGANLFSKSNFVAQQFQAWLENELWLDLARHANAMAAKLADAVRAAEGVRLAWETGGNQLFIVMSDEKAESLRAAGATFYDWDTPAGMESAIGPNERIRRFITSFATRAEDVEKVAALF
ncbi:threonine aldolase family protein [Rhizobium sp.]